jgi:metal transporter CNNM
MTPISDVFMLSIDSKLDYDLLKKICQTGHSRVPVYEEVDVPVSSLGGSKHEGNTKQRTEKMKKILGILLVKQCVLLDPQGSFHFSHSLQTSYTKVHRCDPTPPDSLE